MNERDKAMAAQKMQFVGKIDREDTWAGELADGRKIYTQAMGTMYRLPEEDALNPQTWLDLWTAGKFADPQNRPDVWVVDTDGQTHYYPPNKREAINTYKAEQRAFWAARQARAAERASRPAREGRPARAARG